MAGAAALAVLALGPSTALGAKETAKSGNVRAVLSYDKGEDIFDVSNVKLEILHSGERVYTKKFKPICKGCSMAPLGVGRRGTPLRVRDIDGDKPPEVLVDLYTGGAHCCTYSTAFDRRGTDYMTSRHNWLDSGYRLRDRDGDGIPEFRSSDAHFGYLYDCFACSRFPVQVFGFDDGFDDVTPRFEELIRRDARNLREDYHETKGESNVRAILAAYVADRCNLGDCGDGFRLVRRALEKGYLDRQGKEDIFRPYGKKYVRSLKRVLRDLGYR